MKQYQALLSAELEKNIEKSLQSQLSKLKNLSVNNVKVNLDTKNLQSQLDKIELNLKANNITKTSSQIEPQLAKEPDTIKNSTKALDAAIEMKSKIIKNLADSVGSSFSKLDNDKFSILGNTIVNINQNTKNFEAQFNKLPVAIGDVGSRFDKYNNIIDTSGKQLEKLLKKPVADTFDLWTRSLDGQKATLKDYYKYLGQFSHGFSGVKKTIDTFNSLDANQQKEYAKAIKESNANLGNFFASAAAGGTKASVSMNSYISSLIGAKAATVVLQAASLALNAAITMGVSLAIQGIVTAVTSWVNADKEAIAAAKENAAEAKNLSNELSDLTNKYFELSEAVKTDEGARASLLSTQNELFAKLDLEGQTIDSLIKKYGSLSEAIRQTSIEQLQKAELDLIGGYNASKKDTKKFQGYGFSGNISPEAYPNHYSKEALKSFDILKNAGKLSIGEMGYNLIGVDTSTTEGVLDYYKKLEDALRTLRGSGLTADELNNGVFNGLKKQYDEMTPSIASFNSSITDLNTNLVQQQMLSLQGKELPNTNEKFIEFKQTLIDAAVASNKFIGTEDQIIASVESYLATVPQFATYFENAIPTVDNFGNITKSVFEANANTIDSYQSSLKSIQSALSDTSSLSSSDIADLMQDFTDFDWKAYGVTGVKGVGDLTGALKELAREQYEALDPALKSNDVFKQMYEDTINAADSTLSLSNVLDSLSTNADFIDNLKEEFKEMGTISSDSLSKIITTYPELENVVADFLSQKITEKDLFKELEAAYQTDFENYENSVLNKMSLDAGFYDTVVNNLPGWVKNLAESYHIDFSNYKNLQDAKLGVDKEIALKRADIAKADVSIMQLKLFNIGSVNDKMISMFENAKDKKEKEITDLQTLITGMDTQATTSLNLIGYKPPGKKGGDGEKFSASINWQESSIKNLQWAVDDADNKSQNAEGYENQKKAIQSLIDAQGKIKTAYKSASDDYKTQFDNIKNIDKYKKLIQNNATSDFQKSDFTDEKEYNLVMSASALWENHRSFLLKADEVGNSIIGNQKKLGDLTFENISNQLKDGFSAVDNIISKYDDLYEAINKTAEGQTGQDLFNTYAMGLKSATGHVKYLKAEIKSLNKIEINGAFTQDEYDNELKKLQNALDGAKSNVEKFWDAISKDLHSNMEDVLDAIEKQNTGLIEHWENERDNYANIIDAQKELLQLKKEQNEYEKSIASKTEEISKIEARMAELQKAAQSGDRRAQKELAELTDNLVDKKEDLADTQNDHEYDLQQKALDDALDANNKIIDAKLQSIKSEYETKRDNIQKLYEQEIDLISKASQYSAEEFSKAFTQISSQLPQYGVTQSDEYINGILDAQKDTVKTSDPVSPSTRDTISSYLRKGTGKDYEDDASELNKYIKRQYGKPISNLQALEIAKLLGIPGIQSVNDIKGNDKNKDKILAALKDARFSGGGYVNANLIKSMGEDGLALVKHGEPILTVEQGKLFKELINNMQPLNNLIKLSSPNLHNIITNNNSAPSLHIENLVNIAGNADSKTVLALNHTANDIARQVIEKMRIS